MAADAEDVIEIALHDYDTAKEGWSEIYEKAREDLYFLSDEEWAQWDKSVLDGRKNKPNYTVDQLGQFIHQVSNDIRQNTPTINVSPIGSGADVKTAEIFKGIIKGIEYKSNADTAYDTASDFSIKSSIGFIRVDHDYVGDKGFDQELLIKRVVNPQSCYIDPNSIESDGSDAMYGFVLEEMSYKDFNKRYPDRTAQSFGEDSPSKAPQDQDKFTIAEYFRIVEEEEAVKSDDGQKERKVIKRKVMRYKLSGAEVLEETTFPGKYIPIVPVYGEEAWIEGKRNLFSLIRKSKSSQQLFNLGMSLDIEVLMMQPQAPFIGVAGQFSGFEDGYADPGKVAVLQHTGKDVDGNQVPAPQRLAPPQGSAGFAGMSLQAAQNIKATTGLYDANIGIRSQETSGIAIQRRQQQGNNATFHFGDNLVRSITHVGKILVCAIPEIYDTPRKVRIVTDEEESKMVGINGEMVDDQEEVYNLKEGEYDVVVTTGASYTTQRQEAAEFYGQLLQSMPDLMPVIGDLVFKYQDSAGAPAIASRLKKLVDPKLLDESEREEGAENPQVVALTQQLQAFQAEAQATIGQLQAQLESKQAEIQGKQIDAQIKAKELEIKQSDQQLKAQEMQTKAALEAEKLAIERQKVEIEAYNAQKEAAPAQSQPSAIKLDTTGFQFTKTPEQLALEEAELAQRSQQEAIEQQVKEQQSEAIIQAVGGIQQLLGALVEQTAVQTQAIANQTQVMTKPIQVMRDENGNITGAI